MANTEKSSTESAPEPAAAPSSNVTVNTPSNSETVNKPNPNMVMALVLIRMAYLWKNYWLTPMALTLGL